jgi:hypothetical protein
MTRDRVVTIVSSLLLLAVFCYIQIEVWPGIIGGGA